MIAFPVSVFSDLWSQELKEMKGFEYLNSDESHDDDEEAEPLILSSRTLDAAMTENTPLRQHQLSGRSHEPTRGSVMMKKEDLKAIVECVYNMKENQRQLHSILRKYRLVEETDPPTL